MFFRAIFFLAVCCSPAFAQSPAETLTALLSGNVHSVDVAEAKLHLDASVDAGTDVEVNLQAIAVMEQEVRAMIPRGASAWDKVNALRKYIYQPGAWNGHQAFTYDFADPLGQNPEYQLLSRYLEDRRGNCVTMPILFYALADRLDLNVTLSTAPLHVFVKFTDESGTTYILEATSGAGPTRDVWYRQQIPMTDLAVRNQVYLAELHKSEALVLMAAVVIDQLIREGRFGEAIEVSNVVLEHYPTFAYILVKKATAYYYLMKTMYHDRFPSGAMPREYADDRYMYFAAQNEAAFSLAERLGWQPIDLAARIEKMNEYIEATEGRN